MATPGAGPTMQEVVGTNGVTEYRIATVQSKVELANAATQPEPNGRPASSEQTGTGSLSRRIAKDKPSAVPERSSKSPAGLAAKPDAARTPDGARDSNKKPRRESPARRAEEAGEQEELTASHMLSKITTVMNAAAAKKSRELEQKYLCAERDAAEQARQKKELECHLRMANNELAKLKQEKSRLTMTVADQANSLAVAAKQQEQQQQQIERLKKSEFEHKTSISTFELRDRASVEAKEDAQGREQAANEELAALKAELEAEKAKTLAAVSEKPVKQVTMKELLMDQQVAGIVPVPAVAAAEDDEKSKLIKVLRRRLEAARTANAQVVHNAGPGYATHLDIIATFVAGAQLQQSRITNLLKQYKLDDQEEASKIATMSMAIAQTVRALGMQDGNHVIIDVSEAERNSLN